ncbi:TetR/AcrR family transcriptional regulator [Croceicoccus mobilis]|uniref:HTH tetR-type domain-containing protein n=1 Tax=Croceicoccus mobilis TaxID=1703339 RepID=A0A916Z6H5_9SPHN|nr:TetR/AcrR family transcriptional regulator [Croceicoccus mobilis]GGD78936.1 hypothetical protein GCM10010990_31020 [Croceicoccus mobilis]
MTVTRRSRALRRIRPGGGPEDHERWQQRKSLQTREDMLEAAIDGLVEFGYAGLSINDVVRRTGVSRGAVHHHFPSRGALVAGLIEHVFYHRMRQFLDDFLARLKVPEAGDVPQTPHRLAMEMHWQSVESREYAAFLRLSVAARSDEALAEIFLPAARLYDEVWLGEMRHAFPQWRGAEDEMQLASDIVLTVHTGLLIQQSTIGAARSHNVQEKIIALVEGIAREAGA